MSEPDFSQVVELRQRIAALEAERGHLTNPKLVNADWLESQRLIRELETAESRIANLSAAVSWEASNRIENEARIAALEAERDEAMNMLGAASASNATLEQTVRAANALVTKLRVVHDDARYERVWHVAQTKLGPYTGPKYDTEMEALRAALAREEKP